MPLPKETAWFPAKRYGWGWGIPCRWQGWVCLIMYILALSTAAIFCRTFPFFLPIIVALSLILIALCYWKGEAPRWHWGKD